MATLQPESSVGCYKLIKLLGEGGMGEVWQAHDLPADRLVALKFIRPELLNNTQVRTRFTNEAKTLGKLEQDRIVPLYAVIEEGDRLAFVLRYIEGQSLADRIALQSLLPPGFILSSTRDVLSALSYAHQQGVIHRDVKPQNILVNRQDVSFLTDFGIAVAGFLERATVGVSAIGTPHYMSPEQILRPREVTIENGGHRSDIYSYGVVLFEMLTGQVPFGQNSTPEEIFSVQQAHCQTAPPSPRTINGSVSPAMEAVILRCLEKDPSRRPQSCAELIVDIEDAIRKPSSGRGTVVETSIRATIIEPRQHIVTQLVRNDTPKRAPRAILIAASILFVVGAVSVVGAMRGWFSSNSAQQPVSAHQTPAAQNPANGSTITSQTGVISSQTAKHSPTRQEQAPIPPSQIPAPTNTGPAKEASALASHADGEYQDGNYCAALAALDKAISTYDDPAYSRLRPEYVNACNHERTE